LFENCSELDKKGLEKAEEYGFSLENPITVEWVMEHPKEAVEIMYSTANTGYKFTSYRDMKNVYDKITGAVEDETEQSEEGIEEETEQQNSTEQENSTEQKNSTEQQNFIEQLEESTEQEII
jgi:hypothetical protein